MARPAALGNQVGDRLVATTLAAINSGVDPNTWITQPKTIFRGLKASIVQLDLKPALVVELVRIKVTGIGAQRHYEDMTFNIWCLNANVFGAESSALSLAADVCEAIALDEGLNSIIDQPIVDLDITVDSDVGEGSGFGLAVVNFTCRALYDHSLTAMP